MDTMAPRSRFARAAAFAFSLFTASLAAAQPYVDHMLIDNVCCDAPHYDPRLRKAWGITFDPAGAAFVGTPFGSRVESFDGAGNIQASIRVEIPFLFNGGFVSGVTYNTGNGFPVPNGLGASTPARLLIVTQEGTLIGWTPRPPGSPPNTFAPIIQNNFSKGDRYTGAAFAQTAAGDRLYIADFGNSRIKTLNNAFAPVAAPFTDPSIPPGFAPYNVRVLAGRVYVSYAIQGEGLIDAFPAPGAGIINRFRLDGTLESRLVTFGALNAPCGMAIAPSNFGKFSNALLVANVGDGRINAINPSTGAFLGTLTDDTNTPIFIDGIRAIEFGNGRPSQPTNTLFYSASPDYGVVGIFGRIDLKSRTGTPILAARVGLPAGSTPARE